MHSTSTVDQVENRHLKNIKPLRPYFFFREKSKQKNLPSATSAKRGFALVRPFKNIQGAGSIF